MAHFRFDLVFNEDIDDYRQTRRHEACCCKDWRSVRRMLSYYGRENVTVFKVRWQPYKSWKHDKRKPTPKEIADYRKAHGSAA